MQNNVFYTSSAEKDLRYIAKYSSDKFGVKQRGKYMKTLKGCLEKLQNGTGNIKNMNVDGEVFYSTKCKKAYHFCYQN